MVDKMPEGYKKTEVGVIPEDWEVKTIGMLYNFKNGLNKAKEYFGYGTPIVNYMDVYSKKGLVADDIKGKVFVSSIEIKAYDVQKGDVFFTRTSETPDEIGITTTILENLKNTVFSGFILRARPKNESLDIHYQKYCFSSSYARSKIVSSCTYTTRALTNGRSLSTISIPIPPLREQTAIAESLSDVDSLISSIEKLIAKKQNIKQGTMQELLTGKKRLSGFVDELIVGILDDVIDSIIGGGTPSRANASYWGGNIPWVTVKDFSTFNPCFTQESITELGLTNSATHLVKKGTVITATRMALGKAVIYKVDVSINQDLKAIVPKSNTASLFLYYWFENKASFINSLGGGSTVKGITLVQLKSVPFIIFSLPEQTAIAQTLSDMDEEIDKLTVKLNKYKAIKQGMMQELLTGKRRLV